jgi:hypothetical protein
MVLKIAATVVLGIAIGKGCSGLPSARHREGCARTLKPFLSKTAQGVPELVVLDDRHPVAN